MYMKCYSLFCVKQCKRNVVNDDGDDDNNLLSTMLSIFFSLSEINIALAVFRHFNFKFCCFPSFTLTRFASIKFEEC